MSLQRKTFAILAVTIIGLMALLYSAAHLFVMRSFLRLEEDQARLTVQRVRSELFHDSLASLSATTNDYGAWDRMYHYIGIPAPKSIADEFQDGTLQGLRINSVLVTDRAGQIVFAKVYDFHTHTSSAMPIRMQESLASDPWMRRVISSGTHASGVLLLPGRTVLIAACPITTTEHRGPIRGVVVMTRNLDSQALMDLQTVTRTNLSLAAVSEANLPADFHWARRQFSADPESFPVQALDPNTISAYVMLRDIHEDPAVILRADGDRRISRSGLTGVRYFLAALCTLGFVFAAATWFCLRYTVLDRLEQLHEQVSQIATQHWTAKHVQISGQDEITELGSAINTMLDMVRSTQTKLDLLANNIDQVFWVKDPFQQTFSYVSSSYEKLWGQSCESLYSDPTSWMRAIVPEDRHIGEEIIEKQKKGEGGDVEFRIMGSDGRMHWIWDRFFPVRDSAGVVQQSIGILEDITKYKDAEGVLLDSQDQLWHTLMQRGEKPAPREAAENKQETESPVNP